MFGSGILDVAIGIAFVFVLVSTVCSAIREAMEAWLKTRATYLEYAVRELLQDRSGTGLARGLFDHPLIHGLYQGDYKVGRTDKRPRPWNRGGNFPSYIPASSFAIALMDIAARGPSTDAASSDPDSEALTVRSLRANIRNLQNPAVQRALLAAIDTAQGDLEKVQKNLEAWYDSAMDRVSGWYKRSTHWIIFFVALIVVGALNVNTITIADYLYRNDAVRDATVAAAERATGPMSYADASKQFEALRLPLGWSNGWGAPRNAAEKQRLGEGFEFWNDIFAPIVGLLITALAATLGAPFWFDVLNKIMVIRSTVKPHEKSPEEGSEDRQPRRPRAQEDRDTQAGGTSTSAAATRTTAASPGVVLTAASAAAPGAAPGSSAAAGDLASAAAVHAHADGEMDACDVVMKDESATADEDLPPARGGVA
jgi:hypothetical protein